MSELGQQKGALTQQANQLASDRNALTKQLTDANISNNSLRALSVKVHSSQTTQQDQPNGFHCKHILHVYQFMVAFMVASGL